MTFAFQPGAAISPEVKAILIRTPHFWFTLIAVCISAAIGVELIPPGRVMKIAIFIQTVLTWYGYQAGVQFRSPQVQWPMAQRVAMGLAPLPPLPADVPRAVTEAMYNALYQIMGNVPHGLPTLATPQGGGFVPPTAPLPQPAPGGASP